MLLPVPFAPMRTTNSPGATVNERSSTAGDPAARIGERDVAGLDRGRVASIAESFVRSPGPARRFAPESCVSNRGSI